MPFTSTIPFVCDEIFKNCLRMFLIFFVSSIFLPLFADDLGKTGVR